MNRERVFLIASPLARLVRRDAGVASRKVEGYFPAHPERIHFVRIEPEANHLVLVQGAEAREDAVEVPKSQALALLDVSAGRIGSERSVLRLHSGHEVKLDRVTVGDGRVDLASVTVDERTGGFQAPAWFGPEVTDDPRFRPIALALEGAPETAPPEVTDAGLDSLLDLLESRELASDVPAAAVPASRHVVELDRFSAQARRAGA